MLQHHRARNFFEQFFGTLNRAPHAERCRRQNDFRIKKAQHFTAFNRHAFRHGQDQSIPFGGANKRQRDAGIARRRLNQGRAFFDASIAFSRFDHRQTDTVFDAGQRVEIFALSKNVARHASILHQARQPHQRRLADGVGDVLVNAATKILIYGGVMLGVGHLGVPQIFFIGLDDEV